MKKIFLALFVFGLAGCPTPKDPVVDAGVDVVADVFVYDDVTQEEDNIITIDNWQLTLPPEWTEQSPIPNSQNVALLAGNEKEQGLLLLTKEPYEGSFDEFSIETIRGLRGQGAEVLITTSVQHNEDPFVYVRSRQEGLFVDTWVTVKDNFGYSLNCGGSEANSEKLSNYCQSVFFSFKIK